MQKIDCEEVHTLTLYSFFECTMNHRITSLYIAITQYADACCIWPIDL